MWEGSNNTPDDHSEIDQMDDAAEDYMEEDDHLEESSLQEEEAEEKECDENEEEDTKPYAYYFPI